MPGNRRERTGQAEREVRTAAWVDRAWIDRTIDDAAGTFADESIDADDIDHAARARVATAAAWGIRRSQQIAQGVARTRSVANADPRPAIRRFLKRFQAPTDPLERLRARQSKRGCRRPLADFLHLATFDEAEREAFDMARHRAPPSTRLGRRENASHNAWRGGDPCAPATAFVAARALELDAHRAAHEELTLPDSLRRYATRLLGRDDFFVMYRVDLRAASTILDSGFGRSRCFLGIDPMLYAGDPTRDADDAAEDGTDDPLIGSASLRGAHYVLSNGIVNATEDDSLRLYAIRTDGLRGVSNAENFRYLDRAVNHPSGDALREMDEMHLDPAYMTSRRIYLLDSEDAAERTMIATLMHRLPYDVFGLPLRDFVTFEALARRHGHPAGAAYDCPEAEAFFTARWDEAARQPRCERASP